MKQDYYVQKTVLIREEKSSKRVLFENQKKKFFLDLLIKPLIKPLMKLLIEAT